LAAQTPTVKLPHYTVTDLGTLGGTYSYAFGVNDKGDVSGGAATVGQTDGISETGFLWHNGKLTNIGTLGGAACSDCSSSAGGPNIYDDSPIFSETAEYDPNGEDFCAFGIHRQCLGATWKNGQLRALSTLSGGNNAQALWENDLGQTVGIAESGVFDASCAQMTPNQVMRFEAVIWEANGAIRQLRPLGGDTVGYAFGINNKGQAVGVSGLCSNTILPPIAPGVGAPHAVLWQSNGTPVHIGSLGGGPFTIPGAINDNGEIAGASLAPDGTVHPFLWTKAKGMQDLGGFAGAFVTGIPCCHTINNSGDAVGLTVDGTTFNMRAFLWHGNVKTDLNTLISSNSGWSLQFASSISNAGQITGYGLINGEVHGFLLTPSAGERASANDVEGDDADLSSGIVQQSHGHGLQRRKSKVFGRRFADGR
jgi:probable HAF family extracellular repeat protein